MIMAYNRINIELCRLQNSIKRPEDPIFAHCGLGKSKLYYIMRPEDPIFAHCGLGKSKLLPLSAKSSILTYIRCPYL